MVEATKNETDYVADMTPKITVIETYKTLMIEYHRRAVERSEHFKAYTFEIEGYLATTLGFLFGQQSTDADNYGAGTGNYATLYAPGAGINTYV